MFWPAQFEMTGISEILIQETRGQGAIPFVRFMELALYHPEHGYYEQSAGVIGKAGDFYTNVSTGPLFGELLACQFQRWTLGLRRPVILEAGAHDGRLARDILLALSNDNDIEYWILEPSAKRAAWQRDTLRDVRSRVRWITSEQSIAQENFNGILIAHELLDAFPRHRMGWDSRAHRWFEWGVRWEGERFEWVRLPYSNDDTGANSCVPAVPQALLDVLPDGFTTETCPEAENWWGRMARILQKGYLVAVDYGLETMDFFQPHRAEGTLRSYCRHRLIPDVLRNPGEQDITGMVDFSLIRNAGEKGGLITEVDDRQSRFLTRIFQQLCQDGLIDWPPSKTRQFITLTHEEHLGGAFRVLVQRVRQDSTGVALPDESLK